MTAARETLVLVPGMMCDERLFGPQIAAFQQAYDIIVGDLTGADTIGGLASALLTAIPAERFNLAGLSMGGIVAMAMAGIAPQRVMRLALLDTNHKADLPERSAARNDQITRVRAGHLREVVVEELKPHYLGGANRSNQALLDLLVEMAVDLGADTFVCQALALRDRPDQSTALAAWRGSGLVLCGAEDTLCPPDWHDEIADLLNGAELTVLPGTGHISTLESPDAVNQALRRWLMRTPIGVSAPVHP